MFLPVVVALLLCNLCTYVALVLIFSKGIYFREMWMFMVIFIQVNSGSNFFIYYFQGTLFRTETKELFSKMFVFNK